MIWTKSSTEHLRGLPMPADAGMQEMVTLKTIAETLNTSNDLTLMLDTVVGKLLELTGLTAGWLFLIDERGGMPVYQTITCPQL